MNFFDIRCQTAPFNHSECGLCDDQTSPVAYVDVEDAKKWVAVVSNPSRKSITFTAVDKCVIKDGEQRGRGRCDGMLVADNSLYLVELKDWGRGNWQAHAIDQLESTIRFLIDTHGFEHLETYRSRKAYICNRRKAPFIEPDSNTKKRFYGTYKFRLKIEHTVNIV